MRYGRLFFGALIILATLWVIVGEQITGASSDAVVNARLSTLRAPIAGVIDMPLRPFGTRISKGEALATASDPLVDTIRLNDLELERDYMLSDIDRVSRNIKIVAQEIDTLSARNEIYATHRAAEIAVLLERAQERVRLLMGGKSEKTALAATADDPRILPATTFEQSLALQEADVLAISSDAASNGVYLGDGYNDATATEIMRLERSAEQDRLANEFANLQQHLTALEVRIGAERKRINLLAGATLAAPIDSILWEVLASDGETVQRGQDVLRLMDCGSALVTLSVSDVVYNRLRVGQSAKFRLNGTEELFDGTITRIAGAGAETIYRNLAIAPSLKHLEGYDVSLLVPALREHTDLRCAVGQTGRVFFEPRPLDWFRDLLN